MTLVITSLSLACVFQCLLTFTLISASHWLVEIWQLSRQGTTGELEVEWIQTPEVYVVGYGWLQALLPFPTPPLEHPGELAHRLVTIWLGVSLGRTLWLWSANVHCNYKLITKLTHLHTHTHTHTHTHFSTFFNTFGHLVFFSVGMGI